MLALLLVLQGAVSPAPNDSLPQITLVEALQRAARLDPNYVAALGQVDNAVWARRSAFSVFVLPSITLATTATRSNPPFFNFGTLRPEKNSVQASITASYDLFTGGQKFAELSRSGAALESAHAGELKQRFATALLTESDYYSVLAATELDRVARDRLRRAREQLAVARARVSSGAAVSTDSLNLRLEYTRAQVGQLQQQSTLRTARLELGRRIGAAGPVDAAPLDTTPAPELPITLQCRVPRIVRPPLKSERHRRCSGRALAHICPTPHSPGPGSASTTSSSPRGRSSPSSRSAFHFRCGIMDAVSSRCRRRV
jgi:outer membrane protein